jgi:ATP-dependent Clp protease ATP-binding subunit ClpA
VPTFSSSLEKALHQALTLANERHHEYATLEHLLLADRRQPMRRPSCAPAMSISTSCYARPSATMSTTTWPTLRTGYDEDSKPTAGFQRVIQRAVIHVQSSGREEVTGANVLVAIFAERESHAAYFLQEQDMTRYDAVNYISHGIAKRPGAAEARGRVARRGKRAEGKPASSDAESGQKKPLDALDGLLRQPQREGREVGRSIR